MKLKSIILNCLFLSLFFSCAHQRPTVEKKYSEDVENEFENIENDQQRVLNYYRTLRQKNWDKYKKGHSEQTSKKYYPTERKYSPAPTRAERKNAIKVAPSKPALSPEQVEEINIEIQQNLDYFCMKNRNSGRFNSESQCQSYTHNLFEKCKEENPVYRDREAVDCVKNKLQ